MVLTFDHLAQPHPKSSAWGPDEASLPCPALVIVACKHMQPLCVHENESTADFLLCFS